MARSKLTKELTNRFAEAVAKGYTYAQACDLLHINRNTFHEWMARGEGTDPDRQQTEAHANFANAVKEAKAQREQRWQGVIEEAAFSGTWQAAAWLLERTNRQTYGRSESVELTGKDGGPIKQQVTGDAERREVTAMIDELAARRERKAS